MVIANFGPWNDQNDGENAGKETSVLFAVCVKGPNQNKEKLHKDDWQAVIGRSLGHVTGLSGLSLVDCAPLQHW